MTTIQIEIDCNGEECGECVGTGSIPALVETATGLEACPYIGEPCPSCLAAERKAKGE